MEIKGIIHFLQKLVRIYACMIIMLAVPCMHAHAQPTVKNYTVKNNKMYIALGKQLSDASIDSFANQYNINDLALKKYVRGVLLDSLKILGWKVEIDNEEVFIISKPLFSLDNIDNPAGKIQFTQKEQSFSERFPVVSSNIKYGYNRFRNKAPFAIVDSVVTFYLRNNKNARRVMLAGSFNDWDPGALAMTKTDSGWIAPVRLGAGKYWYKFIVDGNWITDPDNRANENDGGGITNSVFFKTNTVFRLNGYANAKKVYVTSSFNGWDENELLMNKTANGWELPLYLAEGTYTYRFIADRRWLEDPANPDHYPNEFGEYNSVIKIGKPFLFYLEGHTGAKQVTLAGSFNGWRNDELFMKKTDKGWELPYTLGPGNYEYNFVIDGKWTAAPANVNIEKSSGNFYFVINANHIFRLKGYDKAKTVYLAGDFNNWSPNTFAMKKQGDEWVLDVHLTPGKHLYKFVVDGEWIIDPGNNLWEQNEHNTGNSVIWIGR
ncbi:MAG TPA: hypothetical protein VIZ28_09845 [Chitinophagaceae bacterium]